MDSQWTFLVELEGLEKENEVAMRVRWQLRLIEVVVLLTIVEVVMTSEVRADEIAPNKDVETSTEGDQKTVELDAAKNETGDDDGQVGDNTKEEQPTEQPDSEPEASNLNKKECTPECREGFLCIEGVCKSPCNPPCSAMEVCTGKGHCIGRNPEKTVDFGVTIMRMHQPFLDEAHRKYSIRKYNEFKKKRTNSMVLLATGIATTVTGLGFLIRHRVKYDDGVDGQDYTEANSGKPLLFIGWSLEIIGAILTTSGFVTIGKNGREMRRAEAGFFEPPAVELIRPDQPSKKSSKETAARGFSLSFHF